MNIRIVTERYLDDREYWNWIEALKEEGLKIDGKKLLKTKEFSFTNDLGYTKATTTYKILEDNKEKK